MKRCPYCAEEIQDEALKCRFCMSDLTSPLPAPGDAPATADDPTTVPVVPTTVGPKNNGMAIASMVLGVLWLAGIGSVLAIVLGMISKKEIDRSNGTQGGRGLALTGIVLGWIGVVLTVIATALFIALFPRLIDLAERFVNDPVATANLHSGLDAAEQASSGTDDFSTVSQAVLEAADPALTYTTGPSTSPATISYTVSTTDRSDDTITLATLSRYGVCFSIRTTLTSSGSERSTTYGRRIGVPCQADASTPTEDAWSF